MGTAKINGNVGHATAAALLGYAGWDLEWEYRHPEGHRIDLRGTHPAEPESLFEVKAWGARGGTDTVRKAIAVAWDLHALGETRPYVLVLSQPIGGLYGRMIGRAIEAGAMSIRVMRL